MLIFDSKSEDVLVEPWKVFKEFRQNRPIQWSESERLYYAFRHDDIVKMLADKRFTVEYPWRTTTHLFGKTLIDMEGDNHIRLKKAMSSGVLSVSNIKSFTEKFAEPTINELVKSLVKNGSFEFMSEIANRVPTLMTCELLGVPLEKEKWLFEKIMLLMEHLGETSIDFDKVRLIRKEVDDWLTLHLSSVKNVSDDKGYIQLIDCVEEESIETIRMIFWTFLAGGIETSMCLLGVSIMVLSKNIIWLEKLAEDPSSAKSILDEVLRLEPVQGSTVRFALEDVEINGITIKKNQCVKLMISSACRDEKIFIDPDKFDPNRKNQKNPVFGLGIHTCIGRHFTLNNTGMVLRALWKMTDSIEIENRSMADIRGLMFRKPDSIWVKANFKVAEQA